MKKIVGILLACLTAITAVTAANAESKNELSFSENGTFRILQLSDTQDDQYPSGKMIDIISLAIEEAKPDLIVFTGDLVEDKMIDIANDAQSFREGVLVKKNGEVDHEKTLENVTAASDAVLEVFQKSGIPFAIAMGNNDYKCTITEDEWLGIFAKYPNCLVKDMSPDSRGAIDYNLEIKGSGGETVFNIWLSDSMRGGVSQEQIDWYETASSKLTSENGGTPVPALLFQHIQVDDIGNLFEECKPWDEGARAQGLKCYRLNREIACGNSSYTYSPQEATEQFKSWKKQGDVIGAFFGHQHVDGFSGTVDGIELGITYGCETAKVGPYGYRLITLHEDDLKNYDNELFMYKGNAKYGTAHFEKQVYETEYKTYKNPVVKFVFGIINIFNVAFHWLKASVS